MYSFVIEPLTYEQSATLCTNLLAHADAITAELAKTLYHIPADSSASPSILQSEGGKPFLVASMATFWVFLGLALLCALWYTAETVRRYRRSKKTVQP